MGAKLSKIAFVIDTLSCDTSGTEKQLLEIITRINILGYTPYLICLRESEWMREHSLPCPYTVLNYEGMLKISLPRVVIQLRKLIVEQNIHLIHTFFEDSIFVVWLATILKKKNSFAIQSP